jgi:hypothetical protein
MNHIKPELILQVIISMPEECQEQTAAAEGTNLQCQE